MQIDVSTPIGWMQFYAEVRPFLGKFAYWKPGWWWVIEEVGLVESRPQWGEISMDVKVLSFSKKEKQDAASGQHS